MSATRAVISGRVQGVGYRSWTVKKAKSLGLSGWVRNRRDGTVEAVFCGTDANINAMLEACLHGPMMARVDGIERFETEVPKDVGFEERETV